MGRRVDICFSVVVNRLQADKLLHHGLLQGVEGNLSSALGVPTPSPSSWSQCLKYHPCHVFPTSLSLTAAAHFLSFLAYFNTEAPPALLMGLCLASTGVLEPAGAGFVQHRGSSWCVLTQVTPATFLPIHLIAKACYTNSVENLSFPSPSPIWIEG